jgi:hypothetical protein
MNGNSAHATSAWEWAGYPLTVSKDELRRALGSPSRFSFREKLLTDSVIESVLRMSVEKFRLIQVFDVEQSRALYRFFCLTPEHFQHGSKTR